MKLTEFYLAQLNREVQRSQRALEQVPDGKYDWKPHDRSMLFGYLADLVATMPSWIASMINLDQMDIAPVDGPQVEHTRKETSHALLKALDDAVAGARAALENTTDEHLLAPWRLLVAGNVVLEQPRHEVMQDTFSHWSHHRGQMTVYLRLMGAKVPAIFGPSADDNRFD